MLSAHKFSTYRRIALSPGLRPRTRARRAPAVHGQARWSLALEVVELAVTYAERSFRACPARAVRVPILRASGFVPRPRRVIRIAYCTY